MGRPKSTERPEWADALLDWLFKSGAVSTFCAQEGAPGVRTVYNLCDRDPEFKALFARAREAGATGKVEQAWDIARDASAETAQVAKLQCEVLFKQAANFAPRLYGTKVAVGGDPDAPPIRMLSNAERVHRVQALLSQVVIEPLSLSNTDEVKELLG